MRGKALFTEVDHDIEEDHPRLCGEKGIANARSEIEKGSPPPMRGKGRCTSGSLVSKGITPAYAGKSCRPCRCLP